MTVPLGTRATAVVRPSDPLRGTSGVLVLDVIYLAATLALFALVGLIAEGVEKLMPSTRASTRREAMSGEERE